MKSYKNVEGGRRVKIALVSVDNSKLIRIGGKHVQPKLAGESAQAAGTLDT